MQIVENAVQLMKRLEALPAAQALLRKDQEAAQAERVRLVVERDAISAALGKSLPVLLAARDRTADVAAKARADLRKLMLPATEAEQALAAACHGAESARNRINGQLRATAPPSIAAFVAEVDERVAAVRLNPPIVTVDAVLDFGERPQPIGSNFAAVGRWIERAVEVRRKAEALVLEALDETQLEARFAALREEIGAVPGANEAEPSDPSLAGALARTLTRRAAAAQQ